MLLSIVYGGGVGTIFILSRSTTSCTSWRLTRHSHTVRPRSLSAHGELRIRRRSPHGLLRSDPKSSQELLTWDCTVFNNDLPAWMGSELAVKVL